jgi:hypothetical protein
MSDAAVRDVARAKLRLAFARDALAKASMPKASEQP